MPSRPSGTHFVELARGARRQARLGGYGSPPSRSGIARAGAAISLALLVVISCGRRSTETKSTASIPTRIVSMTPALTEILFALGLGDRVVGVTRFCDYPPEAARLPKIGGYVNPSVEAILALRPDLVVVTPAAGNRDAALAIERAGVRLEVVRGETLQDTYRMITRTAEVCGVGPRGEELCRALRERVESASARVRSLPKVRTLFCLQLDPIVAAGPRTLPSELTELAGGENVVRSGRYPQMGIETVLEDAPEVILQARMDVPDSSAARAARGFWERWPSIPAVRDHRLFVIDATTALRPGPRVADAIEMLARLLHPPEAVGATSP